MKNLVTRLLITVMPLVLSGIDSSMAAETRDHEIQVTGGLFMADGTAATGTAQLDIEYGWMFAQNWQGGIRLMASYELNDPIEDIWTASTTGFINYIFWANDPNHKWKPFVGGILGMGYSDVDNQGIVGPAFGLRYDFNDAVSFIAQYHYERYFSELKAGAETTDMNSGNSVMTMGLGYRW